MTSIPRRSRWMVILGVAAALALASLACSVTNSSLTVINNSSIDLCNLYISSSESESWGENRLPETLAAGERVTVSDIEPGVYDLRVEGCDGTSEVERLGEDLSTGETEWTITD